MLGIESLPTFQSALVPWSPETFGTRCHPIQSNGVRFNPNCVKMDPWWRWVTALVTLPRKATAVAADTEEPRWELALTTPSSASHRTSWHVGQPFPNIPSHHITATSQEGLNTPFPTIQSMHNPSGHPEALAMGKNYAHTPSPSITHTINPRKASVGEDHHPTTRDGMVAKVEQPSLVWMQLNRPYPLPTYGLHIV